MTFDRLLRFAFWAAVCFAFVMAVLPHPPQLPGAPSDKILHILAFTVLSGLAGASFRNSPLLGIGIRLSAFGALIELVQAVPALHRDSSVIDWLADTAAVLVVLIIVAIVRRGRRFGAK
jgi:VanZ family protein